MSTQAPDTWTESDGTVVEYHRHAGYAVTIVKCPDTGHYSCIATTRGYYVKDTEMSHNLAIDPTVHPLSDERVVRAIQEFVDRP